MTKKQGVKPSSTQETGTDKKEEFAGPDLEYPPVDFVAYQIAPDPAYIQAALEHDLLALHHRLGQVAEVLEEVYRLSAKVADVDPAFAGEMRQSISWGKIMLQDATYRSDTLIRGLGLDAVPGSKHRPGWKKGGRSRADAFESERQARQKAAEEIWQTHPSWGTSRVACQLAPKFGVSHHTLRKQIHKPK